MTVGDGIAHFADIILMMFLVVMVIILCFGK